MVNRVARHVSHALLCVLAYIMPPSGSLQARMHFTLEPPEAASWLFGTAWTIYADGEIDDDSGAELQLLIDYNDVPARSRIVLNSRGGSLFGGLELGRTIRRSGLYTSVGQVQPGGIESGICLSACAFAFLGGEYRWLSANDIYGIHRFYDVTGRHDNDQAQIISGAIIRFLVEMEIDPELFSEMVRAGQDEILTLPMERLQNLNVFDNGQKQTKWTIESAAEGLYLKGERETSSGLNKIIIICHPPTKQMALYIIVDPNGRAREVVELMPKAHSLIVDGDFIPIGDRLNSPPSLVIGLVNAFYTIDDSVISALERAHFLGIAFQYTYDSPIFLGFDGMEFSNGIEKLRGLRASCRK